MRSSKFDIIGISESSPFLCVISPENKATGAQRKGLLEMLVVILLQDAASIVATKAKRVAERSADGALLSLVEGEVEVVVNVLVAVIVLVVDGGRNDVVLNSQSSRAMLQPHPQHLRGNRHRLG